MILPVFFNWAGRLLLVASMLLGYAVTSLVIDERSHCYVGSFLLASGILAMLGSLYLTRRKNVSNHVMFLPVWVWGGAGVLLGAYCLWDASTLPGT